MKDCRNEYTLDLIQQMYNTLVLSMSSRTLSILLWPFLALSVQVHDKFSHLSCLTPGGRPPWVFEGEFCSARLYRIPHSCSRALRLSEIHVHWRIFTLGEWISSLSCWKMHNNAGMREGSIFCFKIFVFHHTVVCGIHDSVDKAQLPHTFSTHSSLYKSFTSTERHCGGYQALLTVLLL